MSIEEFKANTKVGDTVGVVVAGSPENAIVERIDDKTYSVRMLICKCLTGRFVGEKLTPHSWQPAFDKA